MSSLSGGVWEDIPCPLCPAGTTVKGYLSCGDRLKDPVLRNYSLISCSGCGLVFLSPRPPLVLAPSHHLKEGYDPFISFSKQQNFTDRLYVRAREWSNSWKRRLLLKHVQPGSRVLDVGCGTGEFLASIKDDFQTMGLEPEFHAGEWGRKQFGLEILTGNLDDLKKPNESFDLVTLWHALEHIPHPLEAVYRIKDLLSPNGKVLFALPNINSYDAIFYQADWVALDAPRHLWHFTPETIKTLVARTGLKPVKAGILPLDHFYNILLSEGIHLKTHPEHKFFSPIRMGVALTGSLLKASTAGEGSGMYYIFKK